MDAGWWAARRRGFVIRTALLIGCVAIFILPLIWTALASFGVVPDETASPPAWTFPPTTANYAEIGIAEPTFAQELLTSTGLSIVVTLLTITVGFLAAYSLARSGFRRKRLVAQSFLLLASMPVMAYVIPLNDTVRFLRLHDTFVGVALAQTAVYAPLATFILYGYLSPLSLEWEEAARLDGARPLQVLAHVVLPLVASGVAAVAVIVFVLNWNLFLLPLVIQTSHIKTITVAMSDFFTFERELEWPTAAAALIVSLAPLAVLVAVAHRVLEGFRLGAVE
ncbi:MAG: carbohydrate ABC transporter permease [Chloroflexi bacterium]|nr:carbohydrate ABC transporter permease [Chloroflexota bacterium]